MQEYTRSTKQYLLTLTDRKTRHQIIRLLPNKTSEVVNNGSVNKTL